MKLKSQKDVWLKNQHKKNWLLGSPKEIDIKKLQKNPSPKKSTLKNYKKTFPPKKSTLKNYKKTHPQKNRH